MADGIDRKTLVQESEEAHHVIGELRTIVGRYSFGEETDAREIDDVMRRADAWVKAWRERRIPTHAKGAAPE